MTNRTNFSRISYSKKEAERFIKFLKEYDYCTYIAFIKCVSDTHSYHIKEASKYVVDTIEVFGLRKFIVDMTLSFEWKKYESKCNYDWCKIWNEFVLTYKPIVDYMIL